MFRKEDIFFFILNDGYRGIANEKGAVFQESKDLWFPMAIPKVIPGVTFKFVFASSMWVSKYRMPSGEITQGNSLAKNKTKHWCLWNQSIRH